jgi:hypothetical protein
MDGSYKDAVREELCNRLAEGRSLVEVCKAEDMPSVRSVQVWMNDDEEFAAQVMRAREVGYMIRAEKAVEDAKKADDPQKGRLAFDAERWYLGKLSNAFSDDKARRHELSGPDGKALQVTHIALTGVVPGEG